jgi:predicted dehydrogenase
VPAEGAGRPEREGSAMKRRSFLRNVGGGVAASVVARSAAGRPAVSPNDKIAVAMMGVRTRGKSLTELFSSMPDVDIRYICDADRNVVGPAMEIAEKAQGRRPELIDDIRRALDDQAVDGVVIATPTHWHTPAAVLACEAGKDAYVEKPLSHNFREGRVLIETVKRTKRVVQVGTQSRSRPITQRFVELLQSGKIGTVHMAKVANIEFRPDIGRKPDEPVPEGVNYDLWTGPAPMLPFNRNRFHNTFKWHWNYGTGELGNNGSHWLDLCRWVLGVGLPTEISGMGRKLAFDDDKQTPDTDNLTFNYPDKVIAWEERLWTPYGFDGSENTMVFYGTEGMAHAGRWVGGRYAFKIFDSKGKLIRYEEEDVFETGIIPHIRNFLDCMRSRETPMADVESQHISTAICHLGNVVVRSGRNIRFDPETETIVGDEDASQYLKREYRDHWSSEPFRRA